MQEMQEMEVRALSGEDPPAEGNGNLLQHTCLENSMDRGDWQAPGTQARKSQTQLSDWAHTPSIFEYSQF